MNKLLHTLTAFAALGLTALTAQAQTPPKILIIDLARIYDGHWKTLEQNAKIEADAKKAQEQAAQMSKDGNALVAVFKDLDEQAKNPAATAEAKAKAQADAQKKYEEIQQKRSELNTFGQNTQNAIRQRLQTFKTLMVEEITKVAVEVAKAKGATLLLDKSGPTMAGVSNVLYFDPGLDITDDVLVEINKDRPASAAPAAAAGGSPNITVPGLAPGK